MDFGSSVYKVKPGLKSYLYVSEYANVIDELMRRSLKCNYVNKLSHPFTKSDLDLIMGVPEDTQAIVIDLNYVTQSEFELLDEFLTKPKIKNLSVYLYAFDHPSDLIKSRVSKQGLCVYGDDPNTAMSRKHLSEWLGDECKIHVSDAYKVAQSLDWNLGAILWTIKSYQAVSGGKVFDRPTSQKVLNLVAFQDPVSTAFSLIVSKKKTEAALLAKTLSSDQTQDLIERLRDFLQGISLVSEAVKTESSDKKISVASGRSINDVVFLQPFISRYPFSTITKCNKLLNFTQEHIEQPETAETVALLWAS